MHFALALMYADTAQLGWDPTISRHICPITQEERYDMVVHPANAPAAVYRTKKLLSNVGAEALRGRGTRVWTAVEVSQNDKGEDIETGPLVVIKDCWVDSDRKREGQILEEIRASAVADSFEAKVFEQCLLTVQCYGDVMVNGRLDSTDTLHRRGAVLPNGHGKLQLNLKANVPLRNDIPVVNATPELEESAGDDDGFRHTYLDYAAKTHHRTVFAEVGVPIHDVNSLTVAFNGLRNLVPGEWVPRTSK